jgi:hypothetical protein
VGGPALAVVVVVACVLGAGGMLVTYRAGRGLVRRYLLPLHVALLAAPMAVVALWDLRRHGLDPAAWEGLHYLYLAVPMLLVTAADQISRGIAKRSR